MLLSQVRESFNIKNGDFSRPFNIKSENVFSAKVRERPGYRFDRQSQIVRYVLAGHRKTNNICFWRAKTHLQQEGSNLFE